VLALGGVLVFTPRVRLVLSHLVLVLLPSGHSAMKCPRLPHL
jgi:hypothetical protein